MERERWWSIYEMCKYLDCTYYAIKSAITHDNMPAYKVGKLWRMKKSEVDEWLKTPEGQRSIVNTHANPELKQQFQDRYAEDLIVAIKFKRDPETEMSKSEFRDFLRFYTKLEMKFYDEEKEFIFTETEKTLFLALRPKTRIS